MSEREFEAVIWCPKCKVDIYTLYRKRTSNEGVYVHEADPPGAREQVMQNKGKCQCGATLMRKP